MTSLNLSPKHLAIVQAILRKYPYTFYAYGSRTKDKYRPSSDLDICFREPIPLSVQGQIKEDFDESDLPFAVDLCDYNLMSEDFRKLIANDLVVLQRWR